jgi:hypothetical protein
VVTYPYGTMTLITLAYLAFIPISFVRYQKKLQEPVARFPTVSDPTATTAGPAIARIPVGETKH